MDIWVLYILLGAVAGVLAGLLGVGGGLIIVPVLYEVFTRIGIDSAITMHMAIATSLATILFTAMASTYVHHVHRAVLWPVFWRLTPGILVGAVIGAGIADYLSTSVLIISFAFFELFVSYQMWFAVKPETSRGLPGFSGMVMAGSVIGSVSAVIGIGGGTLTVPFLTWCNRGIRYAVATSSACGFPVALASVLAYFFLGMNEQNLPAQSMGYIYLPAFVSVSIVSLLCAPLGARLAHTLPVVTLRKIFAILLLVIGVRMLIMVAYV